MKVLLGLRAFNDGGKIVLRSGAFSIFTIYNLPSSTARACSARARVFSVWISGRVSPRRVNRQVGMPYITHGFLRADSRNSMGFILLYGKKNVSRYGFRHSVLEATRRPVCHVILQRCAGRDMLDDAAAEAQLAEADELLTAVGFVQYLPRRWQSLAARINSGRALLPAWMCWPLAFAPAQSWTAWRPPTPVT